MAGGTRRLLQAVRRGKGAEQRHGTSWTSPGDRGLCLLARAGPRDCLSLRGNLGNVFVFQTGTRSFLPPLPHILLCYNEGDCISLSRPAQQIPQQWGFRDRSSFSRSCGGYKSKVKVLAGPCSFPGLRPTVLFHVRLPASEGRWPSLVLLGLWRIHPHLCPRRHVAFLPAHLRLCVSSPLPRTTPVTLDSGPGLLRRDPILTLHLQ